MSCILCQCAMFPRDVDVQISHRRLGGFPGGGLKVFPIFADFSKPIIVRPVCAVSPCSPPAPDPPSCVLDFADVADGVLHLNVLGI